MRRAALALGLALSACSGGPSPPTPIEQQPGMLRDSAAVPAQRATLTLNALKASPAMLLETCLERYQASAPSGPVWKLAQPSRIAMSSTADQALDEQARAANPDGWIDRGELRSEIALADGDPANTRCLVCRYDFDDGRSDPLTLFGAETMDRCR
jgi:hypothetical protein